MNLVLINVSAEGYRSGATYDESIFITQRTFERISEDIDELEVYIGDLDGKHSEVEAHIQTVIYNEKDLLGSMVDFDNDGESLYCRLEEIFLELDMNLDAEIEFVNNYIKSLDTYITLKATIKKSQQEEFKQFVRKLQRL